MKKLEAIALYYQNKNGLEIDNLLREAERTFLHHNIYHGIAVCNYARAFFLYHKMFMFVHRHKDEHEIIKDASMACKTSLDYYQRINHLCGQAESHKLQLAINNVQNRTDPHFGQNDKHINRRWEQEITRKIRDIKREQTQADMAGTHKFKFRTTHSELSLLIEVSFQRHKYAVRASNDVSGFRDMVRAKRPRACFGSLHTNQVPVEIKTDKLIAQSLELAKE